MGLAAFPIAGYCVLVQSGQIPHHEALFLALATHNKYSHTSVSLVTFFELDLLDEFLGHEKLSMYHTGHHQTKMERYSFVGVVKDEHLSAMDSFFQLFVKFDMGRNTAGDLKNKDM